MFIAGNHLNASYVAAFQAQAKQSRDKKCLLFHVDDPLERVILNESARIAGQQKKIPGTPVVPPFFGIYPYQNIVSRCPEEESNLYYFPHSEFDMKAILRAYQKEE